MPKIKADLLSVAETVAHAVRLSNIESVVNYPMALGSEINKSINEMMPTDSANSMNAALNMSIASVLLGKRTFMATPLTEALDDFYSIAFQRIPLVIVNISKALGAMSVAQDHSFLVLRDSGWIIFSPSTNQEILDAVIYAYKLAETPKISLPVMVNVDFPLNFTEPLILPGNKIISNFLQKPKPKANIKKPVSVNPYIGREEYVKIKKQQQDAMIDVKKILEKINETWKKRFKRSYRMVEEYNTEDAETIFIVTGFHSMTVKSLVDKLRKEGKKVGLVILKMIRPFPAEEISSALQNCKKVIVIDHAFSPGHGGILQGEIRSLYHGHVVNAVSLGKHLQEKEIFSLSEAKENVVWV